MRWGAMVTGGALGAGGENMIPVRSMRVDGPGAWRRAMFSANSAETMSIAWTLSGRPPADPYLFDGQLRLGAEGDQIGPGTGLDTAPVGRAQQRRRSGGGRSHCVGQRHGALPHHVAHRPVH